MSSSSISNSSSTIKQEDQHHQTSSDPSKEDNKKTEISQEEKDNKKKNEDSLGEVIGVILPPPPPTPTPVTAVSSGFSSSGCYSATTIFCPSFVPPPSAFRSSTLSSASNSTTGGDTRPGNTSGVRTSSTTPTSACSSSSQFELSVEVESAPPPSSVSSSSTSIYQHHGYHPRAFHLHHHHHHHPLHHHSTVNTGLRSSRASLQQHRAFSTPVSASSTETSSVVPSGVTTSQGRQEIVSCEESHVNSAPISVCCDHEDSISEDPEDSFHCLSFSHTQHSLHRLRRNIIMSHHSEEDTYYSNASGTGSDSFWEPGNYKRTVKRAEDGFKLSNDLIQLIVERAEMEKVYAKNLKTWGKKWSELIDKGPEYGTMETAWKALTEEADKRCDLHISVRDKLSGDVVSSIKQWQKDSYHKTMMTLKEKKEFEDNFKKVRQFFFSSLITHLSFNLLMIFVIMKRHYSFFRIYFIPIPVIPLNRSIFLLPYV